MFWKRQFAPAERLVAAVAALDLKGVQEALTAGADPNTCDGGGCPAVAIAASRKWAAGLDVLLRAGADIRTRLTSEGDGFAHSPLINFPAANGSIDTLEVLLRGGADIDAGDATGLTALMCAAFMGHTAVVERLIEAGATLDARDEKGYTALMFAANAGHADVLAALLGAGANANARDHDGSTPLMFAAQHGFDSCIERLLAAGAIPAAAGHHGLSAIDFARQNGHSATETLLTARR